MDGKKVRRLCTRQRTHPPENSGGFRRSYSCMASIRIMATLHPPLQRIIHPAGASSGGCHLAIHPAAFTFHLMRHHTCLWSRVGVYNSSIFFFFGVMFCLSLCDQHARNRDGVAAYALHTFARLTARCFFPPMSCRFF